MAGSVERFEQLLEEQGLAGRVVRLEQNTRTAELAAQALGTEVGAIVKSLVVLVDQSPALAMVSGDKRADLAKLARLFGGKKVEMARGSAVKEITGFAIGGVPPLLGLPALMDRSLLRYDEVWAAAGSPYAVFPISPAELGRLAGARVVDLVEGAG
jgi:prolyl-tRNA editing enzyme YbaK/EbsC (Cys-tRNA(Pro) deacylase)